MKNEERRTKQMKAGAAAATAAQEQRSNVMNRVGHGERIIFEFLKKSLLSPISYHSHIFLLYFIFMLLHATTKSDAMQTLSLSPALPLSLSDQLAFYFIRLGCFFVVIAIARFRSPSNSF